MANHKILPIREMTTMPQKVIVFLNPSQKYTITLFTVLLAAVLSGIIKMELWSQVTYPWLSYFPDLTWGELVISDEPLEPVEPTETKSFWVFGYPFLLRQWVTYPFFIGGLTFNIHPNFLFSISLPFLAAIVVLCISKIAETLSFQRYTLLSFIMLIPISCLFFFMNGRLPIALAGFSLALYSQLCINDKPMPLRIILTCFGILIGSVSTGTMLATFSTVIVLSFYRFLTTKSPSELIPAIISTVLFGLPIIWGIDKVLRFYARTKGSIWNVVEHGFAKQLIDFVLTPIGIVVFVLVVGLGIYSFKILIRYVPIELVLATICTLGLGAFGNSTLSLICIPLTAAAMTLVLKYVGTPPISTQPQPYSY